MKTLFTENAQLPKKILVGLTGNMGCGKSSVAQLLANYPDVIVIDTDTLAKRIAGRPEYTEAIQKIVGFSVDFSQSADRARLAQALFAEPVLLKKYEAFIHPLVWKEVDCQWNAIECGICIVESALLFESGTESRYAKTVMVSCDESVQLARLCGGDRQVQRDDAVSRIAQQMSQREKIERADFVVDNSGSRELLQKKVFELYNQLNTLVMKKEKTKALFVGSFDPLTLGHQWLIEESLKKYDELVVAVTVNNTKKAMFSLEERLEMLREVLPARVAVDSFDDVYSVDYAESIGATVLVRGIRNATDREYENTLARINAGINPSVRTEYLDAPDHLAEISSSMVKMMIGPRGWESVVAQYVAPTVLARMIAKVSGLFTQLQNQGAHGDGVAFWKELVAQYLETGRAYHNLKHVSTMAADLKQVANMCAYPVEVEYAIWFHDFFNETMLRRHINEERSSEKARQVACDLGMRDDFCNRVHQLIMATKHNCVPGSVAAKAMSIDAQIICDLDLVILGSNPRIFFEYESGVRTEYGWLDDDVFTRRRLEILKQFLMRDRIYHTDYFHEKYDAQARINLSASIKKITGTRS